MGLISTALKIVKRYPALKKDYQRIRQQHEFIDNFWLIPKRPIEQFLEAAWIYEATDENTRRDCDLIRSIDTFKTITGDKVGAALDERLQRRVRQHFADIQNSAQQDQQTSTSSTKGAGE